MCVEQNRIADCRIHGDFFGQGDIKDVEQALLEVIAKEGNLSPDEAEDYLNELREEKRYQRDVY